MVKFSKILIVTLSLLFDTFVYAIQIKIQRSVNIRKYDSNNVLQVVDRLKKGTILQIPDKYNIKNKKTGKVDLESTINNWFKKGEISRSKFRSRGRIKRDYYFPVKVVKRIGNGKAKSSTGLIALKALARHKGKYLKLVEDSDMVQVKSKSSSSKQQTTVTPSRSDLYIDSAATCHKPEGTLNNLKEFKHFKSEIETILKENNKEAILKSQEIDRAKHLQARNFETKCTKGQYSFSQFESVMDEAVSTSGIPGLKVDILRRLMYNESAQKACESIGDIESDGSKSVGLFQVNTKSSSVRSCSKSEFNKIKRLSLRDLKLRGSPSGDLHCLQNPIVNLEEAIKVLKKKARLLGNSRIKTRYYGWQKGFSKHFMQNNPQAIFLIISSYNGGQTWPILAKHDLEIFNQKHGTTYNPEKWEDLRLFYMRRWLNREQREKAFGYKKGGKDIGLASKQGRTKDNTLLNLRYVESTLEYKQK